MLLDIGATTDSTGLNLAQYAHMGSLFASACWASRSPRWRCCRSARKRARASSASRTPRRSCKDSQLRFVGNVEGRDLPHHPADVVVCDASVGNVVMKFFEGLSTVMFDMLRKEFQRPPWGPLGYLFMRPGIEPHPAPLRLREAGRRAPAGRQRHRAHHPRPRQAPHDRLRGRGHGPGGPGAHPRAHHGDARSRAPTAPRPCADGGPAPGVRRPGASPRHAGRRGWRDGLGRRALTRRRQRQAARGSSPATGAPRGSAPPGVHEPRARGSPAGPGGGLRGRLRPAHRDRPCSSGASRRGTSVARAAAPRPAARRRRGRAIATASTPRSRRVAPTYPVVQLARIDRALLRCGMGELLHCPTTPTRVAISEWVELARTYSGEPTRRLMNGVLGRVAKDVTEARTGDAPPGPRMRSRQRTTGHTEGTAE